MASFCFGRLILLELRADWHPQQNWHWHHWQYSVDGREETHKKRRTRLRTGQGQEQKRTTRRTTVAATTTTYYVYNSTLITEKSAPSVETVALPWSLASAVLAAWVWYAFVAQIPSPANSASVYTQHLYWAAVPRNVAPPRENFPLDIFPFQFSCRSAELHSACRELVAASGAYTAAQHSYVVC